MGCQTTSRAMLYDCDLDNENWEEGWANEKKAFCCRTTGKACGAFGCNPAGKGCENPADKDMPFDCDHKFDQWEALWSTEKKRWCCHTTGRACNPFDCNIEFAIWEQAWSDSKQEWCC